MAVKTQGTELYFLHPTQGIVAVGCTTSVSGIDSTLDQIETTCLEDAARTYVAGLATPGAATFGINADPEEPGHVLLHQLKVAGTTVPWALGWSDGTAAPTDSTGGEFVLPNSRTWITFDGFVNSFPFDFALNTVVASSVGIQVTGDPVWTPKSTS